MKKKAWVTIAFLFISVVGVALSKSYIRGETISSKETEKRWGKSDFSVEKFKNGSVESRASMAASLLQHKNNFLGLDRSEIRARLGDYSGYYISGMYPTYLIQDAKNRNEEAWQLVFLIDNKGKITDIVVHKNCCYE